MRFLLLIAALAFGTAHAQAPVPAPLEVMRLAPQLVAFAGGDANFASLVNGLALGTPVTLSTPQTVGGTAGGTQVITFTPAGTMSALQIAQLLEGARQSLIARGIATPTAQQLAGALATTTTPATSTIVQQPQPVQGPPATAVQSIISGATGGTAPRNLSDSPSPRGISDTPPQPVPSVVQPAQGTATVAPLPITPIPAAPVVTTTPGVR